MEIVAQLGANALLLAATGPPSTDSGSTLLDQFLPFLNFGLIGLLVVMVLTKTGFVPKWVLDASEKDAEKAVADVQLSHAREVSLLQDQIDQLKTDKAELKATNDQLTKVAQEQFLPALIEANRLTALYVETLARRGGGGQG